MSYESRAYDNAHGDPVVVLVVTGHHDVSRFVNWMNGRVPTVEIMRAGDRIVRQVKRHNGGQAALRLLRVLRVHEDELKRFTAQERGRDLSRAQQEGRS